MGLSSDKAYPKIGAQMKKIHKHKYHRHAKKKRSIFRSAPLVLAFGTGLLGLGVQLQANLAVRPYIFAHGPALTLAAPTASGAPAATGTPQALHTPAPMPAATPKPAPRRVAYVKPMPAVKPAPNAHVDHLVPVAQPSPSSAPTVTPTPAAGRGAGAAPPVYAYTSTNWSGYLASGGKFSGVRGSWSVPHVTGNGHSLTADAAWIGIGGVTGSDLIQVGTTEMVSKSGHVSTNAFYEMLPAPETPVPNMVVNAGDTMSASIAEQGTGQWRISITDQTRSETFSIDVSYASSHSTAEWIEEDPSFASGGLVPFDNFGAVDFTNSRATQDGSEGNLAALGAQAIILVDSLGTPLATPSTIGPDGESFGVAAGP
jgi:hypothetical protein